MHFSKNLMKQGRTENTRVVRKQVSVDFLARTRSYTGEMLSKSSCRSLDARSVSSSSARRESVSSDVALGIALLCALALPGVCRAVAVSNLEARTVSACAALTGGVAPLREALALRARAGLMRACLGTSLWPPSSRLRELVAAVCAPRKAMADQRYELRIKRMKPPHS